MFPNAEKDINLRDLAAVDANRRGQLTDAQKIWLEQAASPATLFQVFAPLIFILPVMCILFTFPISRELTTLAPFLVILTLVIAAVVWQSGGMALKTWQTWSRLKEDLALAVIRQAQGQLLFHVSEYVVQQGEQIFELPPSKNNGGLLPGTPYNFYYLEKSGVIISAEDVYQVSLGQVCSALTSALAGANKFTLDDLETNRSGEITAVQRSKPLPTAIFGFFFALIPVAMGLLTANLFFQGQGMLLATLFVPAFILGIFFIVGAVLFTRAVLDMVQASPADTEGAGYKETRVSGGKNRARRYYYVINTISFQVNKNAYGALLNGVKYRVYYLPRSKRILSMEAVSLL